MKTETHIERELRSAFFYLNLPQVSYNKTRFVAHNSVAIVNYLY